MKKVLFILVFLYGQLSFAAIHCRKTTDLRRSLEIEHKLITFIMDDISGEYILPPTDFPTQPIGGRLDRLYIAQKLSLKLGYHLNELKYVPSSINRNDRRFFGAILGHSPLSKHFRGEYICTREGFLEISVDEENIDSLQEEGLKVNIKL